MTDFLPHPSTESAFDYIVGNSSGCDMRAELKVVATGICQRGRTSYWTKHGFKPANVLLASFIRGVTRDPINRAQFFFSFESDLPASPWGPLSVRASKVGDQVQPKNSCAVPVSIVHNRHGRSCMTHRAATVDRAEISRLNGDIGNYHHQRRAVEKPPRRSCRCASACRAVASGEMRLLIHRATRPALSSRRP